MMNFVKENILVVIFVILTVVVSMIAILDEKKNILDGIKSNVLKIIVILIILIFYVLLVLFDFNVI